MLLLSLLKRKSYKIASIVDCHTLPTVSTWERERAFTFAASELSKIDTCENKVKSLVAFLLADDLICARILIKI